MRIRFHLSAFPVLSETFVLNQITGLLERGHDVSIEVDRIVEDGVVHPEVRRLQLMRRVRLSGDAYGPMPRGKLRRCLRALRAYRSASRSERRLLRATLDRRRFGREALTLNLFFRALGARGSDGKCDVSLCHFGQVGERVARLRAVGAIARPVATVFHGHDLSRDLVDTALPYRHLFAEGDLLMPVSRHWRRRLMTLGARPERIAVHHMGVDTGAFTAAARVEAPAPSAGTSNFRLLTVARFVEKKGLLDAIEAVDALLEEGLDLRYRIVGSGPLAATLSARVSRSRHADAFSIVPPLDTQGVRDEIARSDVFLLPSVTAENGDKEGIPVVLMEAMASGVPVVSTWHSGIPELVEHGVSGLLVPEREVAMLTAALRCLHDDPAWRRRAGRAARERVVAHFDIARLNERLEHHLSALTVRPDS